MKAITPHSKLIGAIALSSILASLGLIGGLGIQLVQKDLIAYLPLLVALPAMNAMAGDYAALTAAHLADPENYKQRTRKLLISLLISLPISCIGVIAISLGAAHFKGFSLDYETAKAFAVQISIALYTVTLLMFGAIFATNKILTLMNVNIDDTLIPIANTLASILTLGAFTLIANGIV